MDLLSDLGEGEGGMDMGMLGQFARGMAHLMMGGGVASGVGTPV